LREFYLQFNKNQKLFEIIFISSDTDSKMFNDYYGEMPWAALPFDTTEDLRNRLKKDYRLPGIPSLVILSPDGHTITDSGRECIISDPTGNEFPWHIKPFWEILQGELKSQKGSVQIDSLKNCEALGIYFSAHWCPPCRKFTPVLAQAYENLKNNGKNFEVIFVSSDHDVESYDEYFKEMPWLALPFNDTRTSYLKRRFKVKGYPRLVIVDPSTGNTISDDGRSRVESDVQGLDFPWQPKALEDINAVGGSVINEEHCLIVLDPNLTTEQKSMLRVVAEEYKAKWKTLEEQPLHFIYGTQGTTLTKLKNFLQISKFPVYIILNIPSQTKYVIATEVTEEGTKKLVEDYLSERIQLQPLS